MRRTTAALVTASALIATLASASTATTSPTTAKIAAVDDATYASGGVQMADLACDGPSLGSGAPKQLDVQPGNDPRSPQSVGWAPAHPAGTGSMWGIITGDPTSAAALATIKIDVYNGSANTGRIAMFGTTINPRNDQTALYWVGKAKLSGTPRIWKTVDASKVTYEWYQEVWRPSRDPSGTWTATDLGAFTLARFAAKHPDSSTSSTSYSALIGFGCDGQTFKLQHLQVGGSSVATTEFGTLRNNASLVRSAASIIAGKGATLRGSAQYGARTTVTLWARPAGGKAYIVNDHVGAGSSTLPQDVTCSSDGSVCRRRFSGVSVAPIHNTAYWWSYGATPAVDATNSPAVTLHVKTAVRPSWPSIARNVTFTVRGSTYPGKSGARVTVYGVHNGRRVVLGSAVTGRRGTFIIRCKVTSAGTWSFYAQIPAVSGNDAGRSAVHSVRLR